MNDQVTFSQAGELAVAACAPQYAAGYPDLTIEANRSGADGGDYWVVWIDFAEAKSDPSLGLIGAPAVLISKIDGAISYAQIPPSFELLDLPFVYPEGPDEATVD